MVYVLDINGKLLMPTERHGKVRHMLKRGEAVVITIKPFTIQLTYETPNYTQDAVLKVDSGYLNIGGSVLTETKELISAEVKLLQNMKERLEKRSICRRARRSRLRYRKERWQNRKVNKGWLAPSIQHKLDSTIKFVDKMHKILPITKTIVEIGAFDIQKIKNPNIDGKEYQEGEQKGFYNTREYILYRDNHQCQNPLCKYKKDNSKFDYIKNNIPLQLHHIIYRSNKGNNLPNNLITLCVKCHTDTNHKKGKFLDLWQTNKPKLKTFSDTTFMNIVRWKLVEQLQEKYGKDNVEYTYGYLTKSKRIELKLEKTHYNDAFCLFNKDSDYNQKRIKPIEFNQIRRNNRSLELWYDAKYVDIRTKETVKANELNNGRRTRNKNLNEENLRIYRGKKISKGQRRIRKQRYFYQPGDLVKYESKIYTVKTTHNCGASVLLKIINKSISPKFLIPYRFSKGIK